MTRDEAERLLDAYDDLQSGWRGAVRVSHEKEQAYRDARAAVLAAMTAPGWRDIESAPKDGTPLMLFARAKHAEAPIRLVGWYLTDRGWIECSFTSPVGIVPYLWQPLPAAPEVPK